MLMMRLVAWLALPLSVSIELLVVGLLLLWFSRRQRLARLTLTAGVCLLVVCSCGPFGELFVERLEAAAPPLAAEPAADDAIRWVVVLGAGYRPDPNLPAAERLGDAGLGRLVEGVRVYRAGPRRKLLVLIGGTDANDGRIETVCELGLAFGIPAADLVIDATGRTTAEEVDVIANRIGAERFVLVTSAFHMSRAVQHCRDRDLDPIPAPTGHICAAGEHSTLDALPSPGNLSRSHIGVSEALGRLWRAVGGG
jgi:uncharacterized SAM-binding protein YcdF (DUF218 family)